METLSVERLHDLYFGAQDRYDAASFVEANFRATRTVSSHSEAIGGGRRHIVHLNPHPQHGISNIRLLGDWVSAELEVGGQRFAKIYPFMGLNGFWYTDGGRAFPHLEYHAIRVLVEAGPAGATILWDDVELNRPRLVGADELYALSHQYTGDETLRASQSKIRLHYNHPVFALYVKTDKPVKGFRLQLNGDWADVPFVWQEAEKRWAAIFQEIPADGVPTSSARTVNFSRVDSAILHVDHDHDSLRVDSWATTVQLTRLMYGMGGLAFSK